jgi:hypothetical protein
MPCSGRAAKNHAGRPLGTQPWLGGVLAALVVSCAMPIPQPPEPGPQPADGAVQEAADEVPAETTATEGADLVEDEGLFHGPEQSGEERELAIHGRLSTRYVRRSSGGDSDSDIYTFLSLDVGEAAHDAFNIHVDGRVARDLSGSSDTFGSLDDSQGDGTRARLYNAYVDFHDDSAELLRVGRQTDYETPEVIYYDGAHFRSVALDGYDSHVGTYGGISNHLYESSTDGDRLYGLYVDSKPWAGGRVRLDFLHAEDERTLGSFDEDLFGLQVWQKMEDLRLEGSVTRLDNENRDLRVASTWYDTEGDLLVRASYYRLLKEQSTRGLEFDELSSALFDIFPYEQLQLSAAKSAGRDVYLEGGLSFRLVDDDDDKGEFNRDVSRYYVTAAFEEVCSEKNTVSVTGEYWDGDNQENEAVGLDLTRDVSEQLQTSLGTYYSLYKTDFVAGSEREDVQTWYMRFDYEMNENYDLEFGYEFEDSDVGDFHNIRMAARWRF